MYFSTYVVFFIYECRLYQFWLITCILVYYSWCYILFFVTGILPQAFLLMEDESESSDIGKLKESFQNVLLSVGLGAAIVGSAGGPWVIETFGRKVSLLLADVVFIIGISIFSMAPYPEILVIGRVCVGLSLGVFTILTPQLLGEISTTAIRGSLTSLNGLFFGLGYLISCLISPFLAKVCSYFYVCYIF